MALSVIWLSVFLGAALGLWQRITTRATGPIRTFAVVAATLVVGLSLLPHAIESEGLWGLAAAAGGLAIIPALDRLVRFVFREVNTGDLRLEVGFIGLSVHRFGDGVVMAVDGHGSDLLWAVGAHEIPIVALVTLSYARRGLAEALVRAVLLGLVSSLGYWLVRIVPETAHDLHGWADAVAAGILIHIVADTGLTQELRNGRERTLDVLGGLLGLAMVLLPGGDHSPAPSLGHRMLAHALDTVPWLGFGLVASAALSAAALRWPRARSRFSAFFTAFGAALGLECVLLSAHLLGWQFAVLGVAGALALGVGAAVATNALVPLADGSEQPLDAALMRAAAAPGFGRRWWALFEQRLFRVAGWFLLGLLGASYIDTFVPSGALATTGSLAQVVIAAALATASSICAPAIIPLVASLVAQGLPPGAALAGLLLGPAAHLLTVSQPGRHLGRARSLSLLLALTVLAWGIGALASRALEPSVSEVATSGASALDWLVVVVLAAVLARRIWQTGIRSWMGASLTERLGEAHRDHAPLELHAH